MNHNATSMLLESDRIDSDVFCDQFHTKEDTLSCRCGSLSFFPKFVCNVSRIVLIGTLTTNKSSVAKSHFEKRLGSNVRHVIHRAACPLYPAAAQAHYSRNMIACNPALQIV